MIKKMDAHTHLNGYEDPSLGSVPFILLMPPFGLVHIYAFLRQEKWMHTQISQTNLLCVMINFRTELYTKVKYNVITSI